MVEAVEYVRVQFEEAREKVKYNWIWTWIYGVRPCIQNNFFHAAQRPRERSEADCWDVIG